MRNARHRAVQRCCRQQRTRYLAPLVNHPPNLMLARILTSNTLPTLLFECAVQGTKPHNAIVGSSELVNHPPNLMLAYILTSNTLPATPLFECTVQGTELLNAVVGSIERAILRLFAQARACAPCLLLIDQVLIIPILKCVAVCCSVLLCVAVCCSKRACSRRLACARHACY